MSFANRHIMILLMLLGFAAQSALAVNALGSMICCDPEMKAMMRELPDNMDGASMSEDMQCHDTDLSCETCCMDAISQTSIMNKGLAVSLGAVSTERNTIQSDQIPNSIVPDFIPPPPNA